MDLYARVRRAVHVEGRSQREVAREFGLARKTARKMLAVRRRPSISGRSRCGGGSWVTGRLTSTPFWKRKRRPRRQRHTAKRILERLREEHSYTGGYTIVKDYVRKSKIGAREMFDLRVQQSSPLPTTRPTLRTRTACLRFAADRSRQNHSAAASATQLPVQSSLVASPTFLRLPLRKLPERGITGVVSEIRRRCRQ